MRYVLLGASGQLGSELVRALPGAGLCALMHADCDVTDAGSLDRALARREFDVVVNLASYNRVDACERDPGRAFAVNAEGAANVARLAAAKSVPVCYVSTDYVFGADAARRRPYDEADEPAPVNVYGRSKLEGERQVRAATADHLIVRTSALFGPTPSHKGTAFLEAVLADAAAGPLRVVNDQTTAPTFAKDLAARLAVLIGSGVRGTVHVTNSGSCTWYEFACEILRQAGIEREVVPIASSEWAASARRPAYSVLASRRLAEFRLAPLRPWQAALEDYIGTR